MPNNQQTDQQALALTHAIALQESGNDGKPNYDAVGDAGTSKGAYQWQPGNFESAAKSAGLDPNDFSPENQDKVAYSEIKAYKDKGYDPGQIASLWNSGSPNNWQNHSGTTDINGKTISYDTPAYVKGVQKHYSQLQGGQIQTQQPPSQESGLPSVIPNVTDIGTELANNISGRLTDLNNAATTGQQGGLHLASGALQAAGAGAGAVGDVLNAGLELVPGVQTLEKGLGDVLGSAAQTPEGQAIIQSGTQLAQAHPEIAGDLAAGANVLSLFPLFKGLSLAKGAVGDSFVNAFKGRLQVAAENEIRTSLPDKAATAVASAESRGLDPIKMLTADGRNLPTVISRPGGGFEYSSKDAMQTFETSLAGDESTLQSKLSQGISKNVQVSVADARQKALADVAKQYRGSGTFTPAIKATNAYFDSVEASLGGQKIISLQDFNALKRDVRKDVNFDNIGLQKNNVKFTIGQSLMKQVEKTATANDIEGVGDINKIMSGKLEAMKVLDAMDGKRVTPSVKSKVRKEVLSDVIGAVGEGAGNMVGAPLMGGYGARALSKTLLGSTPRTAVEKLSRSASTHLPSSIKRGLLQTATGVGTQGLVRPK